MASIPAQEIISLEGTNSGKSSAFLLNLALKVQEILFTGKIGKV